MGLTSAHALGMTGAMNVNPKPISAEKLAAGRYPSEEGEAGIDWGTRNTAGVAIASSLSFDQVCHDYGNGRVLDEVTIAVEPGEVLCLLGPSGSGKTTLLRLAAGIEAPSRGQVLIDGRVVSGPGVHLPPEKRSVGLVFQDYALFPHMNVTDNVRFGLRNVPARLARREAERMLERVGLADHAAKFPHQLSGGEQQRVALARALAPRPAILLMDEPFSGLDARLRDTVREQTIGLLRDTRATTIIVTHDPEEALRVGDHIALMRDGRLMQLGTGRELYERPQSMFAARFFSELNLMHAVVLDGRIDTPLGPVEAAGRADGSPVSLCLRLSDLVVEPRGPKLKQGFVAGRVAARRFLGFDELLEIYIDGHDAPLRARLQAGTLPPQTGEVALAMRPGTAMVFDRQ